jgi:hypothetical protein
MGGAVVTEWAGRRPEGAAASRTLRGERIGHRGDVDGEDERERCDHLAQRGRVGEATQEERDEEALEDHAHGHVQTNEHNVVNAELGRAVVVIPAQKSGIHLGPMAPLAHLGTDVRVRTHHLIIGDVGHRVVADVRELKEGPQCKPAQQRCKAVRRDLAARGTSPGLFAWRGHRDIGRPGRAADAPCWRRRWFCVRGVTLRV